jgi:hypothetical protein
VGVGKPIGDPDLPTIAVFSEAVRRIAVLNRKSAIYGLISQQQGTNHRTRADWLK